MIIKAFYKNIITASFVCLSFSVIAQSEAIIESDSMALITEFDEVKDTIKRKDIRKEKQMVRFQTEGSFFNHMDRPGRKAALYSFGFPGLGQIYNQKYWKLPIVYGAIGTTIFATIYNSQNLKTYNTALAARLRGEADQFPSLSEAQLTSRRNFYRKNMEIAAILTAVFHGLNVVDATVDAHLFKFDISDDLTFEWSPDFLTGNNKVIPGIHLSLTFK